MTAASAFHHYGNNKFLHLRAIAKFAGYFIEEGFLSEAQRELNKMLSITALTHFGAFETLVQAELAVIQKYMPSVSDSPASPPLRASDERMRGYASALKAPYQILTYKAEFQDMDNIDLLTPRTTPESSEEESCESDCELCDYDPSDYVADWVQDDRNDN